MSNVFAREMAMYGVEILDTFTTRYHLFCRPTQVRLNVLGGRVFAGAVFPQRGVLQSTLGSPNN